MNIARIPRILLNALLPLLMCSAAFCLIAYIQWPVALLVIAVFLLAIPFYAKVSIQGAASTKELEQAAPAVGHEFIRLIDGHGIALDSGIPEIASGLEQNRVLNRYRRATRSRLHVIVLSRLVGDLAFPGIMVAVFVILGFLLMQGNVNWSGIVLILLALRFFGTGLSAIMNAITNVNRFYPHLQRYFLLVDSIVSRPTAPITALLPLTIACDSTAFRRSAKSYVIQRGEFVGILTGNLYSNLQAFNWIRGLVPADEKLEFSVPAFTIVSSFETIRKGDGPVATKEGFSLPADIDFKTFSAALQKLGIDAAMHKAFLEIPEKPLPLKLAGKVSVRDFAVFKLAAALAQPVNIIIVDQMLMRRLGVDTVSVVHELLGDRFLAIVFGLRSSWAPITGQRAYFVVDDTQVLGIGGPRWARHIKTKYLHLLKPKLKQAIALQSTLDEIL